MSAEIHRETATVYRVGSKRFFTFKAARRALARARLYEKFPCECSGAEYDDCGRMTYDGERCRLHAMSVDHFNRLLDRMAKRPLTLISVEYV